MSESATLEMFSGHVSAAHRLALKLLGAVRSQAGDDRDESPSGGSAIFSTSPPCIATRGVTTSCGQFKGWPVWTISPRRRATGAYVIAFHGGGFITEPTIVHWMHYANVARRTGATVIAPLYPLLADGGTAETVILVAADLVSRYVEQHGAESVSVYGDSAGGAIALGSVQELVRRTATVPRGIVLISPWLDVGISDPASKQIVDPFGDEDGLRKAGVQWAGELGVNDPLASPLFGSLQGLPPLTVYSGSADLLCPDVIRLRRRLLAEPGVASDFTLLAGGLHGWPGFTVLPEAFAVAPEILYALTGVHRPSRLRSWLRRRYIERP